MQQAIALEEDNTKALFRRGTAYFNLKNFSKAEDDFNQILAKNPKGKQISYSVLPRVKASKMINH